MKKHLAILVFVCAPLASFCQDYVITVQGDTLRGKVRILSMEPIDQVQVIVDKKKTTVAALKVHAVFFDQQLYRPAQYLQTVKFMKVVKSGFLNLYSFKPPNQNAYNGLLLVKRGGQSTEVPNLGFKKIMSGFLEECPAVSEDIKQDKLRRKDLDKIIDMFNACIDVQKKENVVFLQPLTNPTAEKKLGELETFRKQVDALDVFSAKKDVLDILNDIKEKLEKEEAIPPYLYGVLKTHLANHPAITDDLEKLIATLSTK
jgi:hypothetical protein